MRGLSISAAGIVAALGVCVSGATAELYILPVGDGLIETISDNGVAAGSFLAPEYFIWTVENGTEYIGGTVPGSGIGGQARVSADGTRVCGTFLNPNSGFNEMAIYDIATGEWTPLGGIGGMSGTEISSGWGISGDGMSVVGLGWIDAGTAHAIQWTEASGMVNDLGSTVEGQSSRANAVDFDGNVVVGWQDGAGRQGAAWVDGVQELIFDNDGNPALEAFAVSGDGEWVTGYGVGGFFDPGQTYRYNTVTDAYEVIENLVFGGERNMAGTGITADGATIVGGTWPLGPATFGKAFIWRDGVGTMPFSDYLDEIGVSYDPDFNFSFVSAISSDGKWIAGWGDPNDLANVTSWVLHVPDPCPADIDGNGMVDVDDLLTLLANWGGEGDGDIDGSGTVDVNDLLLLLAAWGPCT
jgi:uncharacterized membrane protein